MIPIPVVIKIRSSSNNPTQIRKILSAGIRLEKGIGRGSDKKAAERIIANPHITLANRLCAKGCLKVEIREVKALKREAAL